MRTLNEESDPSKLGQPEMTSIPKTRTETKSEAISSSIFRFIDMKRYKYVKIPKESLEEAFCRDIDAFNEAFAVSLTSPVFVSGQCISLNTCIIYSSCNIIGFPFSNRKVGGMILLLRRKEGGIANILFKLNSIKSRAFYSEE